MDKADFQYETLSGIGRPAKQLRATEPVAEGTEVMPCPRFRFLLWQKLA